VPAAADPHLRRAERLDWLAILEAEHDNIGTAMRGALAAGEAQAAMRLAAGAGARTDFAPPSLGTRKVRSSSSSRVESVRIRIALSSSSSPANRSRT
jgi:hypothetical protein